MKTKTFLRPSLTTTVPTVVGLLLCLGGTPAFAQSSAEIAALQAQVAALQAQIDALVEASAKQATADETPQISKPEPASALTTPDKMFEWNIRGRIFADTAWINDRDNSADIHASEFRAARIGVEGKAWKTVKYILEADFADNDLDVKDAYLQWQGPVNVTMGQFKTPNSLEEITSARHTTLMERSTFTDAFSLDRQIGVSLSVGNDNSQLTAGIFQGGNGVANDDEGLTVAARGHYALELQESGLVHIGGSFRHRNAGDDQGDFRYRVRPPVHLSDRFIDTTSLADSDTFYGLELAALFGPFHIASEYAIQDVSLSAPLPGQKNPVFSGYYLEGGWFLTGEQKGYKAETGVFDRPKVNKPVHKGGLGAWQVAARYDVTDLTDEGVFGGEQENITLGVNWYLNRHTRIMANYTWSDISDAFLVAANGPDGENQVDAFGVRFQVDW